jgi:Ca-activated chloride channel family protein
VRLVAIVFAIGLSAAPARACGVELVLAMDVSRSVVNAEYDLQFQGLANALRNPEVVDAIGWVPGGVMATLTQWSGPSNQIQSIDWHHLDTPAEVTEFADKVASTPRHFFAAYTAVGEALWHANQLSASNPRTCRRRIIDVSGDGASNRGREPGPISAALAANGVTINALVIKGARPDPEVYYAQNVIAGDGAFVEVAENFNDYARAMQAKLLRELAPAFSQK